MIELFIGFMLCLCLIILLLSSKCVQVFCFHSVYIITECLFPVSSLKTHLDIAISHAYFFMGIVHIFLPWHVNGCGCSIICFKHASVDAC